MVEDSIAVAGCGSEVAAWVLSSLELRGAELYVGTPVDDMVAGMGGDGGKKSTPGSTKLLKELQSPRRHWALVGRTPFMPPPAENLNTASMISTIYGISQYAKKVHIVF